MANPFGAILTAAMMLAHLGMTAEAQKIEAAVLAAVRRKEDDAGYWRDARHARGGGVGGGLPQSAETSCEAVYSCVFRAMP